MTGKCPGFKPTMVKPMSTDEHVRLTAYGAASQYHRTPAHPHLFCGCGNEAADCHPGRCCRDDDWGTCTNCGLPQSSPQQPSPDESELSDPLFNFGTTEETTR